MWKNNDLTIRVDFYMSRYEQGQNQVLDIINHGINTAPSSNPHAILKQHFT